MKLFIFLLFIIPSLAYSQKKGTYDGMNTDANGAFRFRTSEKDNLTLTVSFVGFEISEQKLESKGTEINFCRASSGSASRRDCLCEGAPDRKRK